MAVLFRSGDNYKAIGFYMPHENLKDDPDKKDPKKYLMSIDALEQETGIDFFHNLPDNIENTVEATFHVIFKYNKKEGCTLIWHTLF